MDLKENKWFQISVQHNNIHFYFYFYLDNMFWLIDHHEVICIKLRIRLCRANSKLTNYIKILKQYKMTGF